MRSQKDGLVNKLTLSTIYQMNYYVMVYRSLKRRISDQRAHVSHLKLVLQREGPHKEGV